MNRTLQIVLGVILLVAVAGGSFYGGTLYGRSQAQSNFLARRTGAPLGAGGVFVDPNQTGGQRRTGNQAGFLFGQIEEIREGVLVITDSNGKQTDVQVTDTTLIEKNASVKVTDLQKGETVIVSGTPGSDGSITARSVQVAPAGRFGPGGAGQNGQQ